MGKTHEHEMKLENGTFRQYRFGVAVEMGFQSSGIAWSSCTYNRNSGIVYVHFAVIFMIFCINAVSNLSHLVYHDITD